MFAERSVGGLSVARIGATRRPHAAVLSDPAWRALRRAWLASRFRRLMNGHPEAKTSLRAADQSRVVVGVDRFPSDGPSLAAAPPPGASAGR